MIPLLSFIKQPRNIPTFLALAFPAVSSAWITGQCSGGFPDIPDVIRIGLLPNVWAANQSLTSQLGFILWVGPQLFPVLTVLSTSYNDTYISTSPAGSRDQSCPPSYTYTSNYNPGNPFVGDYIYSSSMTCHGYYNFTLPLLVASDSSNFTSPEDALLMSYLQSTSTKYGLLSSSLVHPYTYEQVSPATGTPTVLGLRLNSTYLNVLYADGFISSRFVGLYYRIPSSDPNVARNGSLVGAPFLSQVLLFADYQEKTLSIGLANNTMPLLVGSDNLICVQHSNTTGDLGWSEGSPEELIGTSSSTSSTFPASPTASAAKIIPTGNNAAGRIYGDMRT
ncbi:hypothetical protein B7463_g10596, partial [Scytalidium lignicola]